MARFLGGAGFGILRRTERGQEPDGGRNPIKEIRQVEFFVGRVHAVVGKRKSHHDGRNAKGLLKGVDDRDGAPRAQEHRRCAKTKVSKGGTYMEGEGDPKEIAARICTIVTEGGARFVK